MIFDSKTTMLNWNGVFHSDVHLVNQPSNQLFDFAKAMVKEDIAGDEALHKIAGDDCYLLKIRASGTDKLNENIETQINPVQSVTRVRTTIVLSANSERPCMAGNSTRRRSIALRNDGSQPWQTRHSRHRENDVGLGSKLPFSASSRRLGLVIQSKPYRIPCNLGE